MTSASGDIAGVVRAQPSRDHRDQESVRAQRIKVCAILRDADEGCRDTDKDGRISLLEAFRYAVVETKRVYETDTRLQTEHAQLDDMGTKTGVADPDGKTGEGLLARRFFLDGAARAGYNDPRLSTLYKDKFGLEDQIAQLMSKKASMTADAYDDALEVLLVDLSRKSKAIREIEGRKS